MKTLVIGASENPNRYSNKVIRSLLHHQHEVEALAVKVGEVNGVKFLTNKVLLEVIDTVTLYINPEIQVEYYDYIVSLKPRRVIFNPGTENPTFFEILKQNEIEVVIACTLVLLTTDQY